MTGGIRSAKRCAMIRKIWSLLLLMLASSLVMSATVHAREWPGSATIECSGTVHSEGDSDQSPGDADKGMPHHHGTCHGQPLDITASDELSPMLRATALRPFSTLDGFGRSRAVDPALRPPTA